MATMSFASSSSSSRSGWIYDVFLSFRGQDTRKNFIDHLYTALVQAGIYTFRDDDELPRGEEISAQLRQAIQKSRISMVVFSKGYASSRWCLNELEEILDSKRRNTDRIVLPIFYDIDPSDVRKQTGRFKKSFDGHKKRFTEEKVNKWREILSEAGNLSGWNLKDIADGHESKFIQMIVGDVSKKLDNKHLHVAKYPVGIDFRADKIIHLLSIATNDVCVVGIYGMPGVGKTTIAKAVFNRLCYGYEGCCFLFNVKEMSKKDDGIVRLQEQLLCEILKPNAFKICDEYRGMNVIKERLCHRRVLIVIDDVDQLKQLEALLGDKSWLSCGSIVIITTRDEHLLTQFQVYKKFKVEELGENESLELFSWHAFSDTHPSEDCLDLSNGVVKYCGGLPLALEVLGSSLFKRSKTVWECAIERMRKIPHGDIQKKLELSFDTLDEDTKDVFLDISCFFVGRGREYIEKILHGRCGFRPKISIITLVERSLLTIDEHLGLMMHDLLQDMGREIVRRMSPKHPGKRSRIWLRKDAMDVLKKQVGTKSVEGLILDVRAAEDVSFSTESFTNMSHLQLLQINGVQLFGSFEHLSKELIWLCWLECPLKSLPSNFHLDDIIVLDMQHSNLRELWKEIKPLHKLKILNLSYSEYLTKTPNFMGLSNLERLILEDCPSLIEVHQSIGHLKKLMLLNLEGCCRLRNLPKSICELKSLENLNLNLCSQLQKLPDCLGDLVSLTELLIDGTAIMQLPSSIGNLKNLAKLSLRGYSYRCDAPSAYWFSKLSSWVSPRSSSSKSALLPTSFVGLTSLRELKLSYCGLSESEISNVDLGSLYSLLSLDLSGNKFFNLPTGIDHLPKLLGLSVCDCNNLLLISEIPSSLESLIAINCTSMERVSFSSKARLIMWADGCQNLTEVQGFEAGINSWKFDMEECNNLSDNFKKSLVEACDEDYDITMVGEEIPEWFSYIGEGSSTSLQIPNAVSDATPLHAVVIWIVLARNEEDPEELFIGGKTTIQNKTNGNQFLERMTTFFCNESYRTYSRISHMALTGLSFPIKGGDEIELQCFAKPLGQAPELEVKRCGVHLIVKNADEVAYDESQSSASPRVPWCTEERWKMHLTREVLQQSQIWSVSRNLDVSYRIGRDQYSDVYYWAGPVDGESNNCHLVKEKNPLP